MIREKSFVVLFLIISVAVSSCSKSEKVEAQDNADTSSQIIEVYPDIGNIGGGTAVVKKLSKFEVGTEVKIKLRTAIPYAEVRNQKYKEEFIQEEAGDPHEDSGCALKKGIHTVLIGKQFPFGIEVEYVSFSSGTIDTPNRRYCKEGTILLVRGTV